MKRPRLVYNWRQCWRMISMQCMTLAAAIQGAWPTIPDDLKASLPANVVHWVSLALLVTGIIGRLVHQPKVGD